MEGQRLGAYLLLRKLGEGGMGAVYEGREEQSGERVAVKVLRPEFVSSQAMIDRFLNEARALHRIDHEGTVAMRDCGFLDEETVYLVMEFLQGDTLKERAREPRRISKQEALHITWQLACTLAAAHEKGIVHRDLKPDNVMLVADPKNPGRERVKLLDFGIAKLLEGPQRSAVNTGSGAMMGTPAYMSPEQCRGDGVITEMSDVYALGVLCYELLAGVRPYRGEGAGELIGQHLYATPRPLAELAPEVSTEVIDLVRRMMAKLPESRPRMHEVAEMLRFYGAALLLSPRAQLSSSGMQALPPRLTAGGAVGARSSGALPLPRLSPGSGSTLAATSPVGGQRVVARTRSLATRRRIGDLLGTVLAVVLLAMVIGALAWLFLAYHR